MIIRIIILYTPTTTSKMNDRQLNVGCHSRCCWCISQFSNFKCFWNYQLLLLLLCDLFIKKNSTFSSFSISSIHFILYSTEYSDEMDAEQKKIKSNFYSDKINQSYQSNWWQMNERNKGKNEKIYKLKKLYLSLWIFPSFVIDDDNDDNKIDIILWIMDKMKWND